MPSDEDIALDEKRMYGDRREETTAFVACEMGVARVALSDDQIGRFGLEHRCSARDIAGRDGRLAVATDEDVLVGADGEFAPTGFGPAVAGGIGESVVAADEDGRVARLDGDDWTTVGDAGDVRAIDGDLLATADGVVRVERDGLTDLAGDPAVDVAAAGPDAATAAGVTHYDGDWSIETDGDATVVAADHDADRAHAVVDGDLLERVEGSWRLADPPEQGIVDVAYDAATVAVTVDGVVAIDPVTAKDGAPDWRSRTLGLTGAVGVTVP